MTSNIGMLKTNNKRSGAHEATAARQSYGLQGVRRMAITPARMKGYIALLAGLGVALLLVTRIPLPVRAAELGSNWGAHPSPAGTIVPLRQLASTGVVFSGVLAPTAGHATAIILIQATNGSTTTTLGSVMTRADRVFNAHPAPLSALFSMAGVTPQPGTRYRVAVSASGTTLTSTQITVVR